MGGVIVVNNGCDEFKSNNTVPFEFMILMLNTFTVFCGVTDNEMFFPFWMSFSTMTALVSLFIFPLYTELEVCRGSGTRMEEIEIIVTPINKDINPAARTIRFTSYHLS